jgi:hypothetical protein
MNMLSSNQPYSRVDDGVGSGFVGGALMGGAVAGAAHRWGQKGIQGMASRAMDKRDYANSRMDRIPGDVGDSKSLNKHARSVDRADRTVSAAKSMSSLHNKGFGGGLKGKALAYGGSVIAGGLLGMGADALSD